MPGNRRIVHCLALALLAFAASCLDDASSAPGPDREAAALVLRAVADLGAAAERDVGIRVFYRRTDGTAVDLPADPSRVRVTSGETRRQAVTVQLAPCLADPDRAAASAPGCQLEVELRMLDASGNTLDVQVSRPPAPALPGEIAEIPAVSLSEIASVSVASVPTLRVQDTRTLSATALGVSGQPVAGRSFEWTSSDATIATVTAAGVITALAPGSVVVTARTGIRQGSGTVRIIARVATVDVTPAAPTVAVGGTQQLGLVAKDAAGATLDLAERTLAWQSAAPNVATVSGTGLVTGVQLGTAQLTATVDGVARTVTVTVAPARISISPPTAAVAIGGTTRLTATALDANGNALPGVTFAWSSSAPAVATVDGAGVVTGRASGTAQITATGGGASGTATVTVAAQPMSVTPASTTIIVARTQQLQTQGAIGAVAWRSTAPAIATVDGTGLVTAQFPGVAAIIATSEAGQIDTSIVTARPLTTTVGRGSEESLSLGYENLLHDFKAYDGNNRVIPGIRVRWTTSSPTLSLSAIDTFTVVEGISLGTGTVTAIEANTGAVLRTDNYTVLRPVNGGNSAFFIIGADTLYVTEGDAFDVDIQVRDDQGNAQANRVVKVQAVPTTQTTVSYTARARSISSDGVATIRVTIGAPPPNVQIPYPVQLFIYAEGDYRSEERLQLYVYPAGGLIVAPRSATPATRRRSVTP